MKPLYPSTQIDSAGPGRNESGVTASIGDETLNRNRQAGTTLLMTRRKGLSGITDQISWWLGDGKAHVVSDDFVEKRRLGEKVANSFDLYCFGTGVVISGFFVSWNYGLEYGWGSFLLSFLIMTASFWCSLLCWAELTSALPFVGGPTTWASAAFGSVGGMITGQLDIAYWVLSVGQLHIVIGYFLTSLFGTPANVAPCYYIVAILIANGLLMMPVKWFFRFMAINTFGTLLLMVAWLAVTVTHVDFQANVVNGGLLEGDIEAAGFGGGLETTFKFSGVIAGLVIATWFYTGIECLPHCAEEAIEIPRAISRSSHGFMFTILIGGILCIVVSPSAAPGILSISTSSNPLVDNITAALAITESDATLQTLLTLARLWPLCGCLMGATYTLGRLVYSNSRGGYLPQFLSLTISKTGSPANAQLASSVPVFLVAVIVYLSTDQDAMLILTFLVIVYEQLGNLIKAIVYCRLRIQSPLGLAGGIFSGVTTFLCVISMLIFQPYTRLTIIVFAAHIAVCIPYYVLHVKYRLLVTPEKQFLKEQLHYLFKRQSGVPNIERPSTDGVSIQRVASTQTRKPSWMAPDTNGNPSRKPSLITTDPKSKTPADKSNPQPVQRSATLDPHLDDDVATKK
ncbi:hypothetical protein HDU93_003028 [Gonapodya sp. JEL0774]|nr:hypothetical protein HDU93_003028 [Gonapodya sp. JEL0774]